VEEGGAEVARVRITEDQGVASVTVEGGMMLVNGDDK
jgi:hypothetical protein